MIAWSFQFCCRALYSHTLCTLKTTFCEADLTTPDSSESGSMSELRQAPCYLLTMCHAGGGFDRRDRDEEGFGGREEEGPSRADAADDWGTKKAFVPSGPTRGGFSDRDRAGSFGDRDRGSGFADRERGGGFGDRYSERRSGFGEGDLDRADNADK